MSEKHLPIMGGGYDRIVCDLDGSSWVRERTCEVTYKRGAMYDVAHYSCCGYEFPEPISETGVAENYCPNCGAAVER